MFQKLRGLVYRSSDIVRSMSVKPKAIVRRLDTEEYMSLSFKYSSELVKERQFNFNRRQQENLQIALDRIVQNVAKASAKKIRKKKGNPTAESDILESIQVSLLKNGKPISGSTIAGEAFQNGTILLVGQTEFEIEVNPPTIRSMSLPKSIMAGFPVYPKLGLEFSEFSSCQITWFRSDKKFPASNDGSSDSQSQSTASTSKDPKISDVNWEEVGSGFTYMTQNDDIDRKLLVRCTPVNDDRIGEAQESVSSVTVSSGPGPCPFENRHAFTNRPTDTGSFRVVSYNILADLYADSEFSRSTLFPTCPPYALAVDYRKQLLLKEIMGYHADLICLQEVDGKIFDCDLRPVLEAENMEGAFASKGGKVAEGVVCFYNKAKFSLLDQHRVILSEAITNVPLYEDILMNISENEKLKNRFIERTTVLQIAILKSLEVPNKKLCVANSHLYFHPDADHIRLLQAGMCLRHIEEVVALEQAKDLQSEISVIFCGDFNSTPECGVYQLMTTQYIPDDHPDWQSNSEEVVKSLSLSHKFSLQSACGTPTYTNYTVGFNGCLDYIFMDNIHLKVDEVVPLPSHEEVILYGALPSLTFPSDHIALVCTLNWT